MNSHSLDLQKKNFFWKDHRPVLGRGLAFLDRSGVHLEEVTFTTPEMRQRGSLKVRVLSLTIV